MTGPCHPGRAARLGEPAGRGSVSAQRPLDGRRVVVTRAEDQAGGLAASLRALGAEPIGVPSIRSVAARDRDALRRAVRSVAGARWVGATSPSGVRYGWDAVDDVWPGGLPGAVGVAAIGPGTEAALRARGAAPDWTPSQASGDAFAAELPVAPGDRVVLFRSDIARRALADRLRARGADLVDAVAYHTVAEADPAAVARALDAAPDAVLFTSPSTVRGFLAGLADPARLAGVALLPIGPVTGRALTEAGLPVAGTPGDSTIPGLLRALVRHLS